MIGDPSRNQWDNRDEDARTRPEADSSVLSRPVESSSQVGGEPTGPFILETPKGSASDRAGFPRCIGNYEVLEEVGEGGMGVVFKVWDPRLKRVAALKMIRTGLLARSSDVQRFQLEREALARVKHAHIIAVHDAGSHDGQPFVVMEYLSGGSLHERKEEYGRDHRAAVVMVEKIARAVEEVHRHGMLHRDLKPSNILFDQGGEPFLSDFGLIKLLDQTSPELTASQEGLGTPTYMAPEQTGRTDLPLGPATDVWALGIILYELLTGRRPFEKTNRWELVSDILHRDPPLPRSLCRHLDPGLQAVILACLEKDPQQRYKSASLLADDLGRYLREEPLSVQPPGWREVLHRFVRRRPLLSGTLAAGLLCGTTLLAGLYLTHPERARESIETSLRQEKPTTLIGASGMPLWNEQILAKQERVGLSDDGYFQVGALDLALVRLCRDPQMESYRFKARVRHEMAHSSTTVGLFACCRSTPVVGGWGHFFFRLGYNDVQNNEAAFKQSLDKVKGIAPDKFLEGFKNVKMGNRADLMSILRGEGVTSLSHPFTSSQSEMFTPGGPRGQQWRELSIEVSPTAVRATFDSLSLEPLLLEPTMRQVLLRWNQTCQKNEQYRSLAPIVPTFDSRASLGVFVHRGKASFCQAIIEPLPVQEKQ